MKIAFDIGGVLSKYPDVFRPLINNMLPQIAVYIISDMHPKSKIEKILHDNGMLIHTDNIYCADFNTHGEMSKTILCQQLEIDILIDDFPGYLAAGKHIRLLVMPDPMEPYFHDSWKTDGSEGDFGRRRPSGSKPNNKKLTQRKRRKSLVADAKQLASDGLIDAALDLLYDSVDEMLWKDDDLSQLDSILTDIEVEGLSVDILLGILTATLPAKGRLTARGKFFDKIKRELVDRGEYEEGLLSGLE